MSISEQPKFDYARLLRDPRWQKKRLKIMERDGFACQVCSDNESELHVHHRYYKNSEGPWDYPDRALVTLCKSCHDLYGHGALSGQEHLISEVLSAGAFYNELNLLAEAFSSAKKLSTLDFTVIGEFITLYAESAPDLRSYFREFMDAVRSSKGGA